jgi:DNA-binding NtrC family response regulator
MERTSVAVVSLARAEETSALGECMHRIGLRCLPLSVATLHATGVPPGTSEVILLIGAQAPGHAGLLSALDRTRDCPSLLLLSGGAPANWDPDVLASCWDFARWPCPEQELSVRVRRLQRACAHQPAPSAALTDALAGVNLIGRSPAFLDVLRRLDRIVRRDVPVLIEGETGTGKELIARAVHYLSHRCDGPFVPVNCGALPDNLVENELFGHERGAYTDAKAASRGAVGEAAGGTLFLDEVETLTHKAQATLLRFLSDNEVRPLGAPSTHQADARIVAASNRNLNEMCARGEFRADLFFRLNVLPLSLPPLRQRGEDIEPLARHFIARYCRQHGLPAKNLSPTALCRLTSYHWPGNIRELQNLIHRAVLMTDGPTLNPDPNAAASRGATAPDAEHTDAAATPFGIAKAAVIEQFERSYLAQLMAAADGNVTRAARMAGKERRALGKLLKKHNIGGPATDPATGPVRASPQVGSLPHGRGA